MMEKFKTNPDLICPWSIDTQKSQISLNMLSENTEIDSPQIKGFGFSKSKVSRLQERSKTSDTQIAQLSSSRLQNLPQNKIPVFTKSPQRKKDFIQVNITQSGSPNRDYLYTNTQSRIKYTFSNENQEPVKQFNRYRLHSQKPNRKDFQKLNILTDMEMKLGKSYKKSRELALRQIMIIPSLKKNQQNNNYTFFSPESPIMKWLPQNSNYSKSYHSKRGSLPKILTKDSQRKPIFEYYL